MQDEVEDSWVDADGDPYLVDDKLQFSDGKTDEAKVEYIVNRMEEIEKQSLL